MRLVSEGRAGFPGLTSVRLGLALPMAAVVAVGAVILLLAGMTWAAVCSVAEAAPPPLTDGWTKVVQGGFNDPNNGYSPSWAKFKDHLYLGTFAVDSTSMYTGGSKQGGDIWRTADGVHWEQIGTPGLGNVHNLRFELIVFRDKLYAISQNTEDGLEVWASSDGTEFTRLVAGGFGTKENYFAFPFVFQERLILATSNGDTGGEIWVSDDGQTFRQVVAGGLGHPEVTGFVSFADPEHPDPIFRGQLYVGVSNPKSGGEIWRTADGLKWERVAEKGITRAHTILLIPDIIYKDQLYVFGTASGTLDNILGFDLLRTSDGVTWEQVVENGFNVGKERNVHGGLEEFKGRLYLISNTMDPRVLVPDKPFERMAPRGFQLRVSDDGKTWKQIGEDGFGAVTSFQGGTVVLGDVLYLSVFDYHEGSQLWRSADGEKWELVFIEPEPSFFREGGGALEFKGHLLWLTNDLKKGLEVWRSDEVMVAEASTTTSAGASTTTSAGTPATSATETSTSATGTAPSEGSGPMTGSSAGVSSSGGGLSAGWIALVAVLGAVALISLGTAVFLMVKLAGKSTVLTGPGLGGEGSVGWLSGGGPSEQAPASSSPAFCARCGASLTPGAKFCAQCGSPVGTPPLRP